MDRSFRQALQGSEVYRFSCDCCVAGFGYRSISGFERSFAEEHIADSHRHDCAVVSAAVSYVPKRCQRLGIAGRLRSLPQDRDFWQAFCPCCKSMRAGRPSETDWRGRIGAYTNCLSVITES